MQPTLFSNAKLKIKRADQHIVELNEKINRFIGTDFYRFQVKKDANSGQYILQFQMVNTLPEEIPLVIGDIIHNLRAALDVMMWELVSKAGGTPTKRLSFPFSKTRRDLEGIVKGGEIQILGSNITGLILNVIKPYKGGNDVLYALHSLDNTDKHRHPIAVVSITALTKVSGKIGSGLLKDCTFIVEEGKVMNAIGFSGEFEITSNGKPIFAVLFNKAQEFEGQPVIPTLHHLSQLVSDTVEAVENKYLGRT
jgi:hypothetical protein